MKTLWNHISNKERLVLSFANMLLVSNTINFIRRAPGNIIISKQTHGGVSKRSGMLAEWEKRAEAINKSQFLNSESVNYILQRVKVFIRGVLMLPSHSLVKHGVNKEDRCQDCTLEEGRSLEGKRMRKNWEAALLQLQWFLIKALTVRNNTLFYEHFVEGCSFCICLRKLNKLDMKS